ncbi:hypothetical protein LWI29_021841 [Acer saccharum]|uniref:Uncharacterized protein n=1 Tax=Acer saccharum TaxID=4024 RepID=A0AA39RSM0_ACESA|nr:hypothetical protein LWI29_021841 [Acer saccharum]
MLFQKDGGKGGKYGEDNNKSGATIIGCLKKRDRAYANLKNEAVGVIDAKQGEMFFQKGGGKGGKGGEDNNKCEDKCEASMIGCWEKRDHAKLKVGKLGSQISENMCSSAVKERGGSADSGGSLGSNKGMGGSLGNGGLEYLTLAEISDRRSSKDGNGSDLMSGKVGVPSIDVFVDLKGQVSGVEIGEHISSQFKASSRRGRKVCLAPTRHCMKTRSSIERDKIPWYYEEGIMNGCSDIGKEMGESTVFERRKMP